MEDHKENTQQDWKLQVVLWQGHYEWWWCHALLTWKNIP